MNSVASSSFSHGASLPIEDPQSYDKYRLIKFKQMLQKDRDKIDDLLKLLQGKLEKIASAERTAAAKKRSKEEHTDLHPGELLKHAMEAVADIVRDFPAVSAARLARKVEEMDETKLEDFVGVIQVKVSELQREILDTMRTESQEIGSVAVPKNPDIPAGFTYLGQFIAHDISSNQMCCGDERAYLRLQSVYGGGPVMMPYLFAHYPEHFEKEGTASPNRTVADDYNSFRDVKFRLEKRGKKLFDVPRFPDSLPCMADARNDQNFILSQLHCAFLRFHNTMAEYIKAKDSKSEVDTAALFDKTRREVILNYQWIIVERYLKKLVYDPQLVEDLKDKANFKLFDADKEPRLMPEFRQAAFRIGHSQVLDVYALNETGERRKLFSSDGNDLRGFRKTENLYIDWTVFFDLDSRIKPQPSAAIDHNISNSLFALPFLKAGRRSLPQINLQRSENLPNGLELAGKLREALDNPKKNGLQLLTAAEVQKQMNIKGLEPADLPLWLYILLEAEVKQEGKRLGLLGSHILAEQIMWVLLQDKESLLSKENYNSWRPIINFGDDGELRRMPQPANPNERKVEFRHVLEFLDAAHDDIRKRRLE